MEIIQQICSIVTGVALPLLGVFIFYDAKKREATAKASKAEADNITHSMLHNGASYTRRKQSTRRS